MIGCNDDFGILHQPIVFKKAQKAAQFRIELPNARIVEFLQVLEVGFLKYELFHGSVNGVGPIAIAKAAALFIIICLTALDIGVRHAGDVELPGGSIHLS